MQSESGTCTIFINNVDSQAETNNKLQEKKNPSHRVDLERSTFSLDVLIDMNKTIKEMKQNLDCVQPTYPQLPASYPNQHQRPEVGPQNLGHMFSNVKLELRTNPELNSILAGYAKFGGLGGVPRKSWSYTKPVEKIPQAPDGSCKPKTTGFLIAMLAYILILVLFLSAVVIHKEVEMEKLLESMRPMIKNLTIPITGSHGHQ